MSEVMRGTLRITKALADLQRVRILLLLQGGELCVCQIVEVLQLAPSTISKHLSVLAAADLVVSRKAGRWAYYRLPEGATAGAVAPVLEWLFRSLNEDQFVKQDKQKLANVLTCDLKNLCRGQRG